MGKIDKLRDAALREEARKARAEALARVEEVKAMARPDQWGSPQATPGHWHQQTDYTKKTRRIQRPNPYGSPGVTIPGPGGQAFPPSSPGVPGPVGTTPDMTAMIELMQQIVERLAAIEELMGMVKCGECGKRPARVDDYLCESCRTVMDGELEREAASSDDEG